MMNRLLWTLTVIGLIACDEPTPNLPLPSDQGVDQVIQIGREEEMKHGVDQGIADLDQGMTASDSSSTSDDAQSSQPESSPTSWATSLSLSTRGVDQALGLDCLPNHNLVIAGRTEGALLDSSSAGGADGFVALIDDARAVTWLRQLGTPDVDQFLDVVYHPQDVIIAGGFSTGDFGGEVNQQFMDGVLVALQPDGEVLWQKLLNLGTVNRLIPTPGGVIAVGASDLGGGDFAAFIAEYDLNGVRRWVQMLNSPTYDSATSTTLVNDTLYVTGFTMGSITEQLSQDHNDMFIAALSLTGDVIWIREFGTDGDDAPVRISHDDQGLIVAGYTSGLFGERAYGGNDVAVLKVDYNGDLIWKTQWGTEGSESAYGLATSSSGQILLSGRVDEASWDDRPNPSGDAFIMAISAEGDHVGVWQYGSTGRDEFVDLCLSQDLVNIAGYTGGRGEDLDILIDRIGALGAEREY